MNKFYSLTVNDNEFEKIINEVITNETVLKMKNYRHHYDTTCFDHCMNVSYYCYKICKKFNLDYKSAARAGMLHDLFLYDWRQKQEDKLGLHGFTHPKVALNNSLKIFDLNKKEQDIIKKHMWPMTVILPKYRESYIITLVDKYCAIAESFDNYKKRLSFRKLQRYAYIFLSLFALSLGQI